MFYRRCSDSKYPCSENTACSPGNSGAETPLPVDPRCLFVKLLLITKIRAVCCSEGQLSYNPGSKDGGTRNFAYPFPHYFGITAIDSCQRKQYAKHANTTTNQAKSISCGAWVVAKILFVV